MNDSSWYESNKTDDPRKLEALSVWYSPLRSKMLRDLFKERKRIDPNIGVLDDFDDEYADFNTVDGDDPEELLASDDTPKKQRPSAFSIIELFFMIASCVLLVVSIICFKYSTDQADEDKGFSVPSVGAYDFDSGNMPEDWQDYFDYIYGGTSSSSVTVPMEPIEDRGDLKLKVANGGEVLTYGQIYDKCSPSVVYIKGGIDGKSSYNWGTGIIASSDGYIITNAHVIDGCNSIEVGISGGKSYDAMLVGYDADTDIAVLKIDAKDLTPAAFAPTSTVSVGDTAIAIGNPLGESYCLTMTDGIVSALDRSVNHEGKTMRLLQTSTAINEGNSGGPLINDKGQVIGITNMKVISAASGVEGIGFAIPTDTVLEIVNAIMADGAVYGRATIGITIGVMPEEIAEYYDIPVGLYVSAVNENSDAYAQGLRKGDIILEVNGRDCTEINDIDEEKNKCEIGDSLRFKIWRDGKTLIVNAAIMDALDLA